MLLLFLPAGAAFARIKLTTLPERRRLEIQLDNPAATLVEEERIVTLLTGTNQVDFSWSNTAIDKSTILLRVIDMPLRDARPGETAPLMRPDGKVEMVRVINTTFPPGENALTWEIYADKALAVRVRISYLIANLTRSFDYRAVAENDESTLTLSSFLRLQNISGEEFGPSGIWAGFGNYFERQVGANEAKQMLAWKFSSVPITKTYTFDWYSGQPVPDEPDQRYVAMRYVLTNDKAHNMGLFPLQNGKVRIFQKDSRGGEAFIGEDWGALSPIDADMKLYLGLARDVVVRRKIFKNDYTRINGNLGSRDVVLEYKIENFKDKPLTLDISEDINRLRDELFGGKDHDADWSILPDSTTLPASAFDRKDSRTLEIHIPLPAAPKGDAKVEPLTVSVHLRLANEW